MIALTQIINTEIFACITVLVESKNFVYKQKRQQKLLKRRLLFQKIATFTSKLLQNCK